MNTQASNITVARGTKDILPGEVELWQYIEEKAKHIFKLYNFSEIRTPLFESTQLFERSIGDDTDIVSKEMYTFLDKGNRSLTLRPEGTASIVRAYIQHGFGNRQKINKFYYCGPMFRYERPQAGRYRQFHQIGVESFGSELPSADAEIISSGIHLFDELGLTDLRVMINSVGCQVCRPVIEERLKQYVGHYVDKLCSDCQNRYQVRPLRMLDCKKPQCKTYYTGMPEISESLCQACLDHFQSLLEYLESLGIIYEINPEMVRGLDYYTRTTFEIVSDRLGAQNAVCGGGRYDKLVKQMGGAETPAVGFAFGIERVVMILNQLYPEKDDVPPIDLFVAPLGETQATKCFHFLDELRRAGFRCEVDFTNAGLKTQLKQANRYKARFALILGSEEAEKNVAILKKMINGEQKEIPLHLLVETLRHELNK